jgi:hypothetical protein
MTMHLHTHILLSLFTLAPAWAETPASFLPKEAPPARLEGTCWNDGSAGGKDQPLSAEVSLVEVATGAWGRAVEVRLATTPKSRVIPPLRWVETPNGAIYTAADGENWSASVEPASLLIPASAQDTLTFALPDGPKQNAHSQQWQRGPWQMSTRLNRGGDIAQHLAEHASGHFTTIVLQRGVGVLRLGMGSGAHQDGWQLNRTWPAALPTKTKAPATPDVAQLFALLPADALPHQPRLEKLRPPAARAQALSLSEEALAEKYAARDLRMDPKLGRLSVASATDDEGQALELAVWPQANGSRLLALIAVDWSTGPNSTSDVKLYEYRDGTFRLATFTGWNLPNPADFRREAGETSPAGPWGAGDWVFPDRGAAIAIRPALEDDAAMLGPDTKCSDDLAFEMLWNGKAFERVTLPRCIPRPGLEPEEWALQCVESGGDAEAGCRILFLKRTGAALVGQLVEGGAASPVKGEIQAAADQVLLHIDSAAGRKTTRDAKLTSHDHGHGWVSLHLETDLAREQAYTFESIALEDPASLRLPHYRIQAMRDPVDGATLFTDCPQFTTEGEQAKAWAILNKRCLSVVQREREAFLAAAAKIPAAQKATNPPEFRATFRIDSYRDTTLSLQFVFKSTGVEGAGRWQRSVNYDHSTSEFLSLHDVLQPDWPERLAKHVNAALNQYGITEKGAAPIDTERVQGMAWGLAGEGHLLIHLVANELGFAHDAATIGYTEKAPSQ